MSEITGPPDGNGRRRTAVLDDPHMQPSARDPRATERVVAALLFIGLLGFAAYGGVYWVGGQNQIEAVSLGVGLFATGFGLAAWGKYLLPQGPFVEERHPMGSSEREIEEFSNAVTERGKAVFRRRGFLGALLGLGTATMGVVLAFPLLRSLGPQPKKQLDSTNWKAGSYLVDIDGRRITVGDMEVGGMMTVFPEGFVGSSVDQTMLLRASSAPFTTMPGRQSWTPLGYVAYSKMCTHLGCPVGLYEQEFELLVCPCHQSMFNVRNGAVPQFGPAPRPLPQLPLYIDTEGYLRSQSGYDQAVGPGFWARTSTRRQNGTA